MGFGLGCNAGLFLCYVIYLVIWCYDCVIDLLLSCVDFFLSITSTDICSKIACFELEVYMTMYSKKQQRALSAPPRMIQSS
jgi:hypothetical protein